MIDADDEITLTIRVRKSDIRLLRQSNTSQVITRILRIMDQWVVHDGQGVVQQLEALSEPIERIRNSITFNAMIQGV